jgi:2-amino-4-hydroxy-6-hydroxymethyldihydropteridine diphosphokinase
LPEDAYIAMGSNIEPERNLPLALDRLRAVGTVVAVSSTYQNPALGTEPQPDFLNAVACLRTALSPPEVRNLLRRIERDLGRTRTLDKYAPRTIDLDLSLYGSLTATDGEMTLPHPDVLSRAHVAVPLAEIAPGLRHPVTGEPLPEIAQRLRPQTRLLPRPDVKLCPAPSDRHGPHPAT